MDVKIVGMDTNPSQLCTTSLLVDSYRQVYPFRDEKFIIQLGEIFRIFNINSYLPLFPEEIVNANLFIKNNPEIQIFKKLIPSEHAAKLCADKLALMCFMKSKGIPVPNSACINEPWDTNQYFIKPRCGQGSLGTGIVNSVELFKIIENKDNLYLIQEVCKGPEVTVDVFTDEQKKTVHAVCRERLEIKTGVCTKARLFMDDEMAQIARDIAIALELQGSFCFQVMLTDSGRKVVTDVNPRPGAGTAMSVSVGNDFFSASFANAWEEDWSRFLCPLKRDVYVTRQYAEFVMGSGIES